MPTVLESRPMPRRAAALLLAVVAMVVAGCARKAPESEPIRAVRTLDIAPGVAAGQVDYAGEVRARVESRLGFRVAGKMVQRPVDLGDAVRAGQVLARLDPQDLTLGQEAARQALAAARVNAEQARADLQRFRELREQGFISGAELERRETAWRAAQAQREQAQAQAGVQSNQARYSALVADAAGVVTAVDAEPGAVLAAGAPVLRLAHDGPRDVVFAVPEDQVAGLRAIKGRPGALAVRLWGEQDRVLTGSVREVAAAADAATRTFLVKADIGRSDARLGQTATVTLALPAVPGVIKLPLSAVFEQQGRSTVWLLDRATMTLRAQPVAVAGAEGNQIVVGGGLAAGQTVVTAGVHALRAGQKVAQYVERAAKNVEPSARAASR